MWDRRPEFDGRTERMPQTLSLLFSVVSHSYKLIEAYNSLCLSTQTRSLKDREHRNQENEERLNTSNRRGERPPAQNRREVSVRVPEQCSSECTQTRKKRESAGLELVMPGHWPRLHLTTTRTSTEVVFRTVTEFMKVSCLMRNRWVSFAFVWIYCVPLPSLLQRLLTIIYYTVHSIVPVLKSHPTPKGDTYCCILVVISHVLYGGILVTFYNILYS